MLFKKIEERIERTGFTRAREKIFSVDINSVAIHCTQENIKLNKVEEKVVAVKKIQKRLPKKDYKT